MDTRQLLDIIQGLPASLPLTEAFERRSGPSRRAWYTSQKEHLQGWLSEYDSSGAYNRSKPGQDARHFYTHFQCVAGLLWLAEALGEDQGALLQAMTAVERAGSHTAAQCGAFRRVIPWSRIESLLKWRDAQIRNTLQAAGSSWAEKASSTAFLKSNPKDFRF